MPSTRSPSERSRTSARALSVLSRRFSMRSPVCTRSTTMVFLALAIRAIREHEVAARVVRPEPLARVVAIEDGWGPREEVGVGGRERAPRGFRVGASALVDEEQV